MKRRIWFGIYVATVVLALVSVLFVPQVSRAETVQGNQNSCTAMAGDVAYAAELSASGVPWSVGQQIVEGFIAGSLGQPGAYLVDEEDAAQFRHVMSTIWGRPDLTSTQAHDLFLHWCMRRNS